MKREKIKSFQT